MRISSQVRPVLLIVALVSISSLGLGAQASTPLPTRKPLAQIKLKANEPYYLDAFKADIDRLESGLSAASGQKVKLTSKDKLSIFLDAVDMVLFRQYCDREGIKVSDAEVTNSIAQYKTSLGPNATDAMVDATLRRNGVFTDLKTYAKQDMLFSAYLRAKKADEVKAITQPSSSDVLKAYDDMRFNLRRPTSYRFSMLIAKTQGVSDADKKSATDTMHSMSAKIKAAPGSYDEYFVKGALDPKAAGYQATPYVLIAKTPESKNQYPNLYEAIFKLKEGDVSDVIEENIGLCIVRVSQYLPEKQLGLDDFIEGIAGAQAASSNPSESVLALVVYELQTTKYAELKKTTRDEINAQLRKEGAIVVTVANFEGLLEQPEIDAIKALKGQGYSIVVQ